MMRSLYSGVSGLQNHQTRMDVIGNNISNVNTTGFKRGRVQFQDMISQQMSGAARPNEEVGGVNPKEVGLGMTVASIDNIFTQGNLQSTGVSTDLAIQGNGFFILKNGEESFYTRNGAFSLDMNGTLVNPANGMRVQGWMADEVNGQMLVSTAATPEDLIIQFPMSRDFLKSLGIFQYEKEGFEGDDIAGTVAKLAESKGYDVEIYTSDRDFLQLVSDKITVNIIKKGMSDVAAMTPAKVLEEWGFEPLQIIDYKGLRGDSSDNLPGIPGVGEKTATKLIQTYGNFDNIVAHANEIGGKVGQAIIDNQEIGRVSRDLAIIQPDVELPFGLDELVYKGYEFNEINEFCQKYDLKSVVNKIQPKWKIKKLNTEDIKFEKINSFSNINLGDSFGIALDFEDDNYTDSDVYGIAVSVNKKQYYIDIESAKKDQFLINALKDKNIKKYSYDYKAIKVALNRYDINIDGNYFDLLLAAYLIDSSAKNNLELVLNMFGVDFVAVSEEVSLFSNENPLKAAQIAFFAKELYSKAIDELTKNNAIDLYNNLEIPLTTTLADIEIEGFPLNSEVLDTYGDVFKKKLEVIANDIYELAGEKFNIASPKQIGEILFNKLGLEGNKKMSTNVDVLKELESKHPIVPKILEYRKYFKLITTYVDGLKVHIKSDGKIHAKFNQALTSTGRLSSSEPNLQNISVRDEESKEIRKAFFYKDEDYTILSLDYSQIELRVLASLSDCKELKKIFESGEDIHSATAKKVFNLQSDPTSAQRRKAKTVNFGIVYGISDWGLADQLGISNSEAKQLIENFYASFPEISIFFQTIISNATKDGYVSTLLGRRRYLRELHDSNYQVREFAKRAAMNAPVQGSAADLIKIAMIKVDNALKDGGYKSKLVCQIHDELILKVHKDEKESVYNLVKTTMENALKIDVPLEVDGGFGKTWYEAK